ncbi:hypothetical protein LY78DRAFT_657805 [Colletotrichum sublineola]|nr:hypothetical protein LY78DRAFT_657805 [Colletotrichum sublineola]
MAQCTLCFCPTLGVDNETLKTLLSWAAIWKYDQFFGINQVQHWFFLSSKSGLVSLQTECFLDGCKALCSNRTPFPPGQAADRHGIPNHPTRVEVQYDLRCKSLAVSGPFGLGGAWRPRAKPGKMDPAGNRNPPPCCFGADSRSGHESEMDMR